MAAIAAIALVGACCAIPVLGMALLGVFGRGDKKAKVKKADGALGVRWARRGLGMALLGLVGRGRKVAKAKEADRVLGVQARRQKS